MTISPLAVSTCWALFAIGAVFMYIGDTVFYKTTVTRPLMCAIGLGLWILVIIRLVPLVFT